MTPSPNACWTQVATSSWLCRATAYLAKPCSNGSSPGAPRSTSSRASRWASARDHLPQGVLPKIAGYPRPGSAHQLRATVARLRTPTIGCPWDLEQTHRSLRPYVIEEAYEVADAIDDDDPAGLADELGDLL